jgi:hypothetical protein
LRPKKLGQTNDLRALPGGIPNKIEPAGKILLRVRAAPHLDKRDFCFRIRRHFRL